ncbi:MAG: D-sedoheptulose 7-phosphate isomerase [Bacteroidota bacterium]
MSSKQVKENFLEAKLVLEQFIANEKNFDLIEQAGKIMVAAILGGKKIISCGNGGSMADAMHFAEELSGIFRETRPALPAIAISDPSHISCVANDLGFEHVFSRFIEGLGQEGDVLLAISTSGNSPNIIKAVESAKTKKIKTIGLTGKSGGKLAKEADISINVPGLKHSDRIQEIHIKIIHSLIHIIEDHLNRKI